MSMEENLYRIWKLVAITTCINVLSMSGCTMHQSFVIQQMVAGGADPMRSACAISDNSNHDKCLIVAAGPAEVAHE